MPPVIGKGERMLVYGIVGTIDIVQIIFDFFLVTEPLNHFIDVGVGICLLAYALKRKLLTAQKGLVLGTTFFAEQIPFVNALPFWTYDVHNLYKGTSKEAVSEESPENTDLNSGGVRRPSNQPPPLNQGGMRKPQV